MAGRSPFVSTFAEPAADLQRPFDAAVVIPTILRPELHDALLSVFRQDFAGRVHVLVGIDALQADPTVLYAMCEGRPPNCVVQAYDPGYSTSVRHGGLSPARDGGALRCVLSYLANSAFVAYLDDDNWWRPDHLRLMRAALNDADWTFSLRWFVHPTSRRPICVDEWESLGPDRGIFVEKFGGFVDPNCLMLNKVTCEAVLPLWNRPLPRDPKGMSADRVVFDALRRNFRVAATGEPSVFYKLDPNDGLHPGRCKLIGPAYDASA
jgi:hypothetical protein